MNQKKNTLDTEAEMIPVTKENYKKILQLTYRSLWRPPFVFVLLGGFFALPFFAFLFLAKLSVEVSFIVSLAITVLYAWLGPLLYVKVSFHQAKKDPKLGLRKHRHLSRFDEM